MKLAAILLLTIPVAIAACATGGHSDRFTDYVDANGVHTYYERYGNGPPLVLVHGAAMVAEGWRPQIDAFQRYFTVYVPERRGIGRTPDIEGAWSYTGMAADTAAFMDVIGITDAAIIGLSDGGIIALIVGYSRPDLVSRLVVSGANVNPEGLGQFKDEVERMTAEELLANVPAQVVPWLELHRSVAPDQGAQLVEQFEKMMRMWLDFEITPSQLADISAPTLVMAGDHDIIPVAHTVEIWAAVPDAKLCIAPDASHFGCRRNQNWQTKSSSTFCLGRLLPTMLVDVVSCENARAANCPRPVVA